jgi:LacI family transcriptional regulator, galactose operon repressor
MEYYMMNGRANIREIAELAGVSTATVSRALNNHNLVNELTRKKVMQISRQYNYRAKKVRKPEAYRDTKVIGLLLPDLADEYYSSIISGIDAEAQHYKHRLLIHSFHGEIDNLKQSLRYMESLNVDGLILMAPRLNIDLKDLLPEISAPIVTLNTKGNLGGVGNFKVDNTQGVHALIDHFVNIHEYRRIGMITGPIGNVDAEERSRGFYEAMERHQLELDPALIVEGKFNVETGYYAFSRLLSLINPPEAVFISNDMMAIGAYEAAKSHNVKIGKDIAIGSFDDIYMAKLLTPALTSVHVPIAELGAKAFRYLEEVIKNRGTNNGGHKEDFSTGLIVRESCGCMAH